jgi:hypothetical protein
MRGGVSTRWWLAGRYIDSQVEDGIHEGERKYKTALQSIFPNRCPKTLNTVDVEIVLDPRKCANSKQPLPAKREILAKEKILEHEFITNNLNIVKCNVCLECHIEQNVLPDHEKYICKKCHKRKDPDYFMKNNLQPIWFESTKMGQANWIH